MKKNTIGILIFVAVLAFFSWYVFHTTKNKQSSNYRGYTAKIGGYVITPQNDTLQILGGDFRFDETSNTLDTFVLSDGKVYYCTTIDKYPFISNRDYLTIQEIKKCMALTDKKIGMPTITYIPVKKHETHRR